MKTLFVTVDPAFPPVSGLDLRTWQNVTAATALGPVLLASIGRPVAAEAPPPAIEIAHITGMETTEVWDKDFDVVFATETVEQFRSVCARFQPDIIVLESMPLVNLAPIAKECARACVIDLHNVESDLAAQDAQRQHNPDVTYAMEERAKRIGALEQKATVLADAIWVCSRIDRKRLTRDGAAETAIDVIPNGIPRPEAIPDWAQRKKPHGPPALLFLGHLHYPPNIDAAIWLVDLMPALWDRVGGARLILAGRNPHPSISAKSQPGRIEVVADPRSTSSLLTSADIAVMPLHRGGGTRIKAIEAMAWGLPVVATARAVEGLGLQGGVHVQIAETMPEFVAAIVALCGDNTILYETQRLAARQYVMSHFGPDAVCAAVRDGLLRVLSR